MMCLKKKKAYEAQIEKLAGAQMTLNTQLMTIEGAKVTTETLEAMNLGNTVLKNLHKGMYVYFLLVISEI